MRGGQENPRKCDEDSASTSDVSGTVWKVSENLSTWERWWSPAAWSRWKYSWVSALVL